MSAQSQQDYAARVAAEVAARYGVAVQPEAVQRVDTGVSGRALPVWDGSQLVYPDWKEQKKRDQAAQVRARKLAPVVSQRRQDVARLHAEGLHDRAIAEVLGIDRLDVQSERRALKLLANPSPVANTDAVLRAARIVAMHESGANELTIAATVGLSLAYLRMIARTRLGIVLRPVVTEVVKPQKPAPLSRQAAQALRRSELAALKVEEMTVAQIGARFGVSRVTVWLDLRAIGRSAADVRKSTVARAKAPRAVAGRQSRATGVRAAARAKVAARRVDLAAMIAGLDRAVCAADLAGFAAVHGSSLRALRDDMVAISQPWPKPAGNPVAARHRGRLNAARTARRELLAAWPVETLTVAELAARCGVTEPTICSDLQAIGRRAAVVTNCMGPRMRAQVEARRAQIADLHSAGNTLSEMRAATGLSTNAVARHLAALGLVAHRKKVNPWIGRTGGTPPAVKAKQDRARALLAEMRAAGATYPQMVAATGLSKASVGVHLRAMGLTGQPERARAA